MNHELQNSRIKFAGILVAIAVIAVAIPLLAPNYYVLQATTVLTYLIALLGLNLLTGYNGQISLGHGAFYGLGAYITAILVVHAGSPYWVAIPVAAFVCMIAGFLFGIPALRLEGLHLALATFALAVALPHLLKHTSLVSWTGGFQGLSIGTVTAPAFLSINPDQWLYFLSLAIAALMFCAAWNIVRGRSGRAITAIRENPIAATCMGINVPFYKTMTFGVSALYAGIAGSLSTLAAQFVSPDSFPFILSITFLVGAVVGGLTTLGGALFGALFIQFIPIVADHVSKAAPSAIFGVTLIGCIFLMPEGVVGSLRSKLRALSRRERS
ncbi:branched-chain amino acid ABC transporter permease [Pseudorhodoplanes sp.]|uniref:branched-chain amino acid ABC transporter permease n=1 Tax=Pseudorhodoplanes sp. TaxID=1934341 RepID=UPI003D0F1BAB